MNPILFYIWYHATCSAVHSLFGFAWLEKQEPYLQHLERVHKQMTERG